MQRTRLQRAANDFDAQLYGLMDRALNQAAHSKQPGPEEQWATAYFALRTARLAVRKMMHPADRSGTEGDP